MWTHTWKLGLLFTFLAVISFSNANKNIGKKCKYKGDCNSASSFTSSFTEAMTCDNGYCNCKPAVEIEYSYNMEPECKGLDHQLRLLGTECDATNATSCGTNEECLSLGDKGDGIWRTKSLCYCKEGYLRVNDNCVEVTYVNALESCGGGTKPRACNLEDRSKCSGGRCICFDDYFANKTSGKCEPMKNYLEAYNLTEYRVKPNEYCATSAHCISGLECRYAKCSCPAPCNYNSTREICDCGSIARASAVGPIIVGIIAGVLILVFWCCMIKKTARKYTEKPEPQFIEFVDRAESTPATSPRHYDGISSNNPAPVGLAIPSSNENGNPSSMLSHETSPLKPPLDPISPPQPSLYGLNPPQAASPSAPPAYSELPSTTDVSSPYPLNPTANDNSAPPYPITPSELPYPIAPTSKQ